MKMAHKSIHPQGFSIIPKSVQEGCYTPIIIDTGETKMNNFDRVIGYAKEKEETKMSNFERVSGYAREKKSCIAYAMF